MLWPKERSTILTWIPGVPSSVQKASPDRKAVSWSTYLTRPLEGSGSVKNVQLRSKRHGGARSSCQSSRESGSKCGGMEALGLLVEKGLAGVFDLGFPDLLSRDRCGETDEGDHGEEVEGSHRVMDVARGGSG